MISSCASGKLFMNQNSKIHSSTLLTVEMTDDPLGLISQIEGELMGLGFEVVPYDIAKSKAEIQIKNKQNEVNIAESYTTYVPTSIVMKVKYTYACGMTCSIGSLNIRIVDLNKERVLGNYSWSGIPQMKSTVINGFISAIKEKTQF